MLKTLKEIAAADAALAALIERPYVDPDVEIDVGDAVGESRPFREALKTIVGEALADDELDRAAVFGRLREIAAAGGDDDPPGRSASLLESVRREITSLRSELDEVRRRESARRALESAGLDAASLDAERLALLDAQPDEDAARALIESWPAWVGRRRRQSLPSPEKYPETVDEFVAAVS